MVKDQFDLDKTLLGFSGQDGTLNWSLRDSFEGTAIFGGIGSGKTSGSGRLIALKYLAHGFGGLVLTVKPDERDMWLEYARITGRSQDIIVIEPGGDHYFNFLQYESTDDGSGKTITDNIVQVLKTVIRASEEKATGKVDDPFWETAQDLLLFNLIELSLLAYGNVTIQDIYDLAQSIPRPHSETQPYTEEDHRHDQEHSEAYYHVTYRIAHSKINALVDAWESAVGKDVIATMNDDVYDKAMCDAIPEARRFRYVERFMKESFINLNEKTRSIIDFSLIGFLFRMLQEPVYSLFCRYQSSFLPEDCFTQGKIIIINLPVKAYYKVGRDAQIMFKYIWQRAMEKRNVKEHSRPVFLWADEAQNFLHEYDADYQATARSSRIATVYISQNLPNYFANMGGERGRYKVLSFLGSLATKFFHANADTETNRYASALIGEAWQKEISESEAATDGKVTVTKNISSKLQKIVRPEEFGLLTTGGPLNEYKVSGYIHLQGKRFSNGFNFKKIVFNQNQIPNK